MAQDNDEDIKSIYDEKISFRDISDNPILMPVMHGNEIYKNHQKALRSHISKIIDLKKELEAKMKANPNYLKTDFVRKMKSLIENDTEVIRIQRDEKIVLIKIVNDMIKINKQLYRLIDEEKKKEIPEDLREVLDLPDTSEMEDELDELGDDEDTEKEDNGETDADNGNDEEEADSEEI